MLFTKLIVKVCGPAVVSQVGVLFTKLIVKVCGPAVVS